VAALIISAVLFGYLSYSLPFHTFRLGHSTLICYGRTTSYYVTATPVPFFLATPHGSLPPIFLLRSTLPRSLTDPPPLSPLSPQGFRMVWSLTLLLLFIWPGFFKTCSSLGCYSVQFFCRPGVARDLPPSVLRDSLFFSGDGSRAGNVFSQ